jgi:protein-S-isoprenylcysteine O-methyltransferase Ste14
VSIAYLAVAYSILWQNGFWERPLPGWRLGLSALFLMFAALLSWSGARSLGRQWRIDAGLNADHELVTSGPYRLVRHPIYTSMLCLCLGTGFMITPTVVLAFSILVFMVGTEIRVRIEERLLAARFGERFREYQRTVPAYVPFLR